MNELVRNIIIIIMAEILNIIWMMHLISFQYILHIS